MSGSAPRLSRRLVAVAAPLAAAGCARLFVAPPGRLYRLTAKSTYRPGLPRVEAQLLVDLPEAPAGIDTDRIALASSPISLDYFADSQWTDRVPLLVQTALVAFFEESGAITAVDREAAGLRADFVVKSEIRHFEADYSGGAPEARVAIGVKLVRMPERVIVAQAGFDRRAAAAGREVPDIVLAFDAALGTVLQDIVLWTLANPALSRTRRPL